MLQTTTKKPNEVISIQYLRALAAIGVVILHFGQIFRDEKDYDFLNIGVDIFFVISGFIMWMVTRKAESNPRQFLIKRILRIAPLYWLVTISFALVVAWHPSWFYWFKATPEHVGLSLAFIPHTAPMPMIAPFPFIGQGWTLNYEMFFYLLFTATLAYFHDIQFNVLSALLITLTIIGWIFAPELPIAAAYTSPLLLEFLAGICIYRAWQQNFVLPPLYAWCVLVASLIMIGTAHYFEIDLIRIVKHGVPAMLLIFAAVSLERTQGVPQWPWLKFLGDASYAIYLVHYIAWECAHILLIKLGISIDDKPYFFPIAVLVAVSAGALTHVYVEKPMGRYLTKTFAPSKRTR